MKTTKIVLTFIVLTLASSAFAQFNIKDKLKEKSANRAETRVDEGIDQGIDKIEQGVGKLFRKDKKENEETSGDENESSETQDEETNDSAAEKNVAATSSTPSLKGYSKYDFVPGDQVIFYEDFSQDAIGDFPALWTTNGGGEVKTVNIAPGNWFHMNKEDAVYCYTKNISFPANFIVEFDIIPDEDFSNGFSFTCYEEKENMEMNDDLYPGTKGVHVSFDKDSWLTKGYNNEMDGSGGWIEGQSSTNPVVRGKANHVILWIQGRRLRIYHQGAKALDMPTNIHAGTAFNRIRFSGWSAHSTPYMTNLKITTAAPDTRNKLLTEGKIVSYGIYFDVNSDKIKPESFGALNDIAKVLKEAGDVKVKVIGHTDSDGDDTKNLDLSKRRAAAVKNALATEFGITGDRIQTDGKGESVPIAPNTSSEGKAKNRRVEFVKI